MDQTNQSGQSQETDSSSTSEQGASSTSLIVIIVLVVLFLIAAGSGGFIYYKYSKAKGEINQLNSETVKLLPNLLKLPVLALKQALCRQTAI